MMDKYATNHTLTQQASKGAFWGLLSNILVSAVSFVGTAVLARILSPHDFGLIGMADLVLGVVNLFGNFGFGAAVVQKKATDQESLSTVYWTSISVGFFLFLATVVFAPFAAYFFKEAAIKWIILLLSFNYIISSFSSVHTTMLYKNISLKKIGLIELVSRVLRVIVVIILAVLGFKFWSIVIGMIAERILKTILFCFVFKWQPSFVFSKEKFNNFFRFGRNLYGEGFLDYFSRNMDFIVTGKIFGAGILGFYQFSYNLPYLVQQYVRDGLGPVVFPVFCKVNDDQELLARGLFKAVEYVSIMIFPIMFGLAYCAHDFVMVAYGDRWLPAVASLRVLCFSASLASIHCLIMSVFGAIGRPDIGFKWSLLRLPLTIFVIVFCARWGILGVAWGMLIVESGLTVLSYIATKMLRVSFMRYLKSLLPSFVCSSLMLVGLFLFNQPMKNINVLLRLTENFIVGGIIYFFLMRIFYRDSLESLFKFIRLSFRKAI